MSKIQCFITGLVLLLPTIGFSVEYQAQLSLQKNASNIAKSCSPKKLSRLQKQQCYQAAKKTYQRYLVEELEQNDAFLTSSIHPEYTDKVVISIHSYTLSPYYATDVVDYAYQKGASGIYVGLQGHRNDGVRLRDIKGKEWRDDTDLVTQIAQGFGDKVILAGFSLGGLLSIEQANRHPNLVAGYLAMAPSFHGGELLPMSEKSCLARVGLIRGLAEKFSGQDLNNEFVLGGCAIFRVSRSIADNVQNHLFATYNKSNPRFQNEKLRTKSQVRRLKMPGVILFSKADRVVSQQTVSVMSEIISEVAGRNFYSLRYDEYDGPSHSGDSAYFNDRLEFSGYDGIDFLFKKLK